MKKRLLSLGLAAVMALSLTTGALAAGGVYQSGEQSYYVGDYTYRGWSELYTGGGYQAITCVREKNNQPMPARSMGAVARLYNREGKLIEGTYATYNSEGATSWSRATPVVSCEGPVYSKGQVLLYSDANNSFLPFDAPRTVVAGSARSAEDSLARIAAQLTDEGTYPVNANGKTYGSALLAEEVGFSPDLISAVGVYGVHGYVRAEDMLPDVDTPDQAQAYMDSHTSASWIPLYDADENVVGVFELSVSQPGDDPAANDQAHAEAEAAMQQLRFAAVQEEPPQGMALNYSAYPVNSLGLTYGTTPTSAAGKYPDLIAALNNAGVSGYIRNWQDPTLHNPSDVEAFLKATEDIPYFVVPLYDSECNVIGNFIHMVSRALTQEEIDAALSRRY